MTISSKIFDQANIFGKIEIFTLDISAVVKNDNFEQNPKQIIILSKILDRANIFGKIEIFILEMSAVVKNDNL